MKIAALFIGVSFCLAPSLATASPAMPEAECAAHLYNETASLNPQAATAAFLTEARHQIALYAYYFGSKGFQSDATPPDADDLTTPKAKSAWAECQRIAHDTIGEPRGDSDHFVIWNSDDGQTPTQNPKMNAFHDWPYQYANKIVHAFGPFVVTNAENPKCYGTNIYIFFYKGVP